jgi:hypothetical protein
MPKEYVRLKQEGEQEGGNCNEGMFKRKKKKRKARPSKRNKSTKVSVSRRRARSMLLSFP